MGCYDEVIVNCPKCGEEYLCQSKSGECLLDVFTLKDCPEDVLYDVNRHAPHKCQCGANFTVDMENRKAVFIHENNEV